ncbi:MAG: AAA family ATPase [Promethearchaeota archaeon]|nr:MAG: AAA family ATPase [Candidatus Lokiarchaeota archaeon]
MDEDAFREEFSRKSVFRKASSLDLSYVPDKLYCRDEVTRELIHNFKRVLQETDQPSITVLLTGKGGVGKTVTARYFGKNFKKISLENNLNVFIEYFNAINFRTKSMILRELLSKYTHSSGRGYSDDEAIKLILSQLIREKGYMLLIIDEVHLLDPEEIWAFLDIAETFGHQNAKLSVILISRTKDWMRIETERILSRLNSKIKLDPYNFEDSMKILKYRSDIAFKDGVISDNILEMVSQIVVEHGNMRHGIEVLRKCGLHADKEGFEIISPEMIREASNEVYPTFRGEVVDRLSDHELLALYGISQSLSFREEPYTIINDAFNEYKAICETYGLEPHVKMSFRKYVRQLNDLKIIATRGVKIGENKRGRHLQITLLDIPSKKLLELLERIFSRKFE